MNDWIVFVVLGMFIGALLGFLIAYFGLRYLITIENNHWDRR